MKRAFRNIAALTWTALALGFSPLWAQKPKSQKEQQAILAVQMAKTPDERVAAIEKVLTDFADTEFKVRATPDGGTGRTTKERLRANRVLCGPAVEGRPEEHLRSGDAGVGNRPAHARKRSG